MRTPRMLPLVALLARLGTACAPQAPGTTPGLADPRDKTGQASALIGPEGGTLTLPRGQARGATLRIPAGALARPVTITMRATQAPTDLPQGVTAVGPAVDFGPEGQTFARPVTVTLPTTRAAEGMYTRPRRNGPWTKIHGARYDPARRVVLATVTHFSIDVGTVEYDPHYKPSTGFNPEAFPAVGYLLRTGTIIDGKPYELIKACVANCTATLIHPRVAITAAHCFGDLKGVEEFAIGFGNVCEQDNPNETLAQIETCSDPNHQKILPKNLSVPGHPIKQYDSIHRVSKVVISKRPGDEHYDQALLLLEKSITSPQSLLDSIFWKVNAEEPTDALVGTLPNSTQRVLKGYLLGYTGGHDRYLSDEMIRLGYRDPLGYLRSPDLNRGLFPSGGGSGGPFFYLTANGQHAVLMATFAGRSSGSNAYVSAFDHDGYINAVMDGLLKDHPEPDCSEFSVLFVTP